MTTTTMVSSVLTQETVLTQAEHHGLWHGVNLATRFNPPQVYMKDSVLFTFAPGTNKRDTRIRAVIQADYNPLIGQKVTLAFAADKAAIKKAKAIRGKGDVRMRLKDGHYNIQGDHTQCALKVAPLPAPETFALPIIDWVGTETVGYDPKDIKEFLGKDSTVQLAVHEDQIEQLGNSRGRYTLTAGMADRLIDRCPNQVFKSQVAFRFIGPNQSLRLGKRGDQYFLRVTNHIDMKVDLVVIEHLDVVAAN
uniref:Uncharacterized protein n=1 Tax=Desulfovibrio sp. U5L TaxID=596152 RepID=I2Q4H1_9BACT